MKNLRAILFTLALASSVLVHADAFALGKALHHATRDELARMPELSNGYPELPVFGDGDIFMVFAHADDELLTLAQVGRFKELNPNRRVHWIMVSNNGKGKIMSEKCLFLSKTECRLREARQVAACMGIDPPIMLGYPDGGLPQVPDLSDKIWAKIDEIANGGPIAVIISSDAAGLYGHPDHMAVHDAMFDRARERGIPYVTYGLPQLFQEKITLKPGAVGRPRPDVTHAIELTEDMQQKLVCAMDSYKSQRVLLWHLRQGLSTEDFFAVVHRGFLNLTE